MADDIGSNPELHEEDLGRPVTELRDLRDPVPSGFLLRVRNAIQRRTLAGDLTRFSFLAPMAVLMELFASVFEYVGGRGNKTTTHEDKR